jgi:hypothetical protein
MCQGEPYSKLFLVLKDTFTREVVRILTTEIIPQFSLPESLQSDNGPTFKAEVTQGLSRALGINYGLHCAWWP